MRNQTTTKPSKAFRTHPNPPFQGRAPRRCALWTPTPEVTLDSLWRSIAMFAVERFSSLRDTLYLNGGEQLIRYFERVTWIETYQLEIVERYPTTLREKRRSPRLVTL